MYSFYFLTITIYVCGNLEGLSLSLGLRMSYFFQKPWEGLWNNFPIFCFISSIEGDDDIVLLVALLCTTFAPEVLIEVDPFHVP